MPASNATPFPVKGQPYFLRVVITSLSTGNRITSGLTGLYGWVVKDDGTALVAMTTTPTEAVASSGIVNVNLSAAELGDATSIIVGATNSGAVEVFRDIQTVDLTENTGVWDAQSPVRFEDAIMDTAAAALNQNNLASGVNTLYKRDGSSKATGTYTETDTSANRGKLS